MTERERWGEEHVYLFRVTDTGVENLLNPSTLTNTLLIGRISLRFKNYIFIHADILQLLLLLKLRVTISACFCCLELCWNAHAQLIMYTFDTLVSKSHVNGAFLYHRDFIN